MVEYVECLFHYPEALVMAWLWLDSDQIRSDSDGASQMFLTRSARAPCRMFEPWTVQ